MISLTSLVILLISILCIFFYIRFYVKEIRILREREIMTEKEKAFFKHFPIVLISPFIIAVVMFVRLKKVYPERKKQINYLFLLPFVFIFALAAFFVAKAFESGREIVAQQDQLYKSVVVNVPFVQQTISINPEIAKNFSTTEIQNIKNIQSALGFVFTQDELKQLENQKFVIKNILDTNLVSNGLPVQDNMREMVALYKKIAGDTDYKERTPANTLFISADSMMHMFSILSAELLKEAENTYLAEQLNRMTVLFYQEASMNYAKAKNPEDKQVWEKVRTYFAVPYVLLSTNVKPITAEKYFESEESKKGISLEEVQATWSTADKDADTFEKAAFFARQLGLSEEGEKVVLTDLKQVYEAGQNRGTPEVFREEFENLPPEIQVGIPFTLFKPRGTYTSSSLRRQYFRAVQWYQQIPFLLGSQNLTKYALGIAKIADSNPTIKSDYASFSSLIGYVVGESDDLDLPKYIEAVRSLTPEETKDLAKLGAYFDANTSGSRIKSMPVTLTAPGVTTVTDEMKALRGLRLMSQKFIPDSYWTSTLTQGDEAPQVNGQRLPDKASMLEVMSILGSPYATEHLSDLPFYKDSRYAVDTQLEVLKKEARTLWTDSYWKSNLYTSSLWTITGMFDWLEKNRVALPQFMQSKPWGAKTLLTAGGFWTELRHTSLLYAKQSFAEMGGGGDDTCDTRKVPESPKGYVEPQAEAYDRLLYTAKRLSAEYKARGITLSNQSKLEKYIELLEIIREYTKLELENNKMSESVTSKTRQLDGTGDACTESFIAKESSVAREGDLEEVSRWEELRTGIVRRMAEILPLPVEGPILSVKDKRAAVVADIHTDKAGGVLEEGTGVPRIIFVAVKDINGPRLTVGFTYSQYETISGERLTDEEWQENFYAQSDDFLIKYQSKKKWPEINIWFQSILGNK